MKALTFNKNSWHFLLATKVAGYNAPYSYEGYICGDSADICTYTRHVMGGLLLLTFAGLLIAGVGFILSNILLGIWFSIMLGMFFFSEVGTVGLVFIGAGGGLFGLKTLINWYVDRSSSAETIERPDGFVKHAYKSWKEKYCLKINFVDKNGQHDDNLRADGHNPGE